jgi:hypothetical protein
MRCYDARLLKSGGRGGERMGTYHQSTHVSFRSLSLNEPTTPQILPSPCCPGGLAGYSFMGRGVSSDTLVGSPLAASGNGRHSMPIHVPSRSKCRGV